VIGNTEFSFIEQGTYEQFDDIENSDLSKYETIVTNAKRNVKYRDKLLPWLDSEGKSLIVVYKSTQAYINYAGCDLYSWISNANIKKRLYRIGDVVSKSLVLCVCDDETSVITGLLDDDQFQVFDFDPRIMIVREPDEADGDGEPGGYGEDTSYTLVSKVVDPFRVLIGSADNVPPCTEILVFDSLTRLQTQDETWFSQTGSGRGIIVVSDAKHEKKSNDEWKKIQEIAKSISISYNVKLFWAEKDGTYFYYIGAEELNNDTIILEQWTQEKLEADSAEESKVEGGAEEAKQKSGVALVNT
jgi:hypothetical protein